MIAILLIIVVTALAILWTIVSMAIQTARAAKAKRKKLREGFEKLDGPKQWNGL